MTALRKLRVDLGWTPSRLAKEAGVSRPTIKQAEEGKRIKTDTAKSIADALTRAYKRDIQPSDIEGLNIL